MRSHRQNCCEQIEAEKRLIKWPLPLLTSSKATFFFPYGLLKVKNVTPFFFFFLNSAQDVKAALFHLFMWVGGEGRVSSFQKCSVCWYKAMTSSRIRCNTVHIWKQKRCDPCIFFGQRSVFLTTVFELHLYLQTINLLFIWSVMLIYQFDY